MRFLLGAAATLALVSSQPTPASPMAPSASQLEAWREFSAASHGDFDVLWGDRSGAPRSIRRPAKGHRPRIHGPRISQHDAEAIARRFLEANARLFDLRDGVDDLAIAGSTRSGRRWNVWVQQMYDGVPVEGGEYRLRLERDGSFEDLEGGWVPDVDREPQPWIRPEEAESVALESLGFVQPKTVKTELDREWVGMRRRLVYCTRATSAGWFELWGQVRVDPRTGEILDRQLRQPRSDPR